MRSEGHGTTTDIRIVLHSLATIDGHAGGVAKMMLQVFTDIIARLLNAQQDIIHMLHRAVEHLFGITEGLILQGLAREIEQHCQRQKQQQHRLADHQDVESERGVGDNNPR